MPALVRATVHREQFDLVIIGAGGAGLAAAVTAADLGARVVVLEKMPIIGGNTQLAAGGMNAAGTKAQAARGIVDDWKTMYEDTMKGGYDRNDAQLVEIMTRGSSMAVDWLTSLGGTFTQLERSGGARAVRTHQPVGGAAFGPYVTRLLLNAALERRVTIRTRSRVVEIVKRADGGAGGVVARDPRGNPYIIESRAVIVASGGYGSSPERIAKHRSEYARFSSTGQPGTTGDAHDFVAAIGGDVYDLNLVQIHPTQALGAKTLISETVRGAGAILVNREGRRFVDEITTRDRASSAILKQPGGTAFVLFDHSIKTSMHMFEGYEHLGLLKEGGTVEALAREVGIEPSALAKTIDEYNRFQADKRDEAFGRADMPRALSTPKFYAIAVQPGIHFTMGGIRVDARTRILRADRTPVPALYAAGEVASGVHGANRLGGNAMTALFTFGPIAGREAAAQMKGRPS
jgi:fumarate reductase flavoprotein subunit